MKKKIAMLSLILITMDQVIKIVVDNYLVNVNVIDNFLMFRKVYNEGAAFSFFTGQTFFLIIISFIILGYIVLEIKKFKVNMRNVIAFSLIIGGLIGNLIDRIIYGHVIDYIKFVIGNYNAPVFNFADMCIFFGVILLIIAIFKKEDEYEVRCK